jgi:hypothetical protein
MIVCGVAAFALPSVALAKDSPLRAAASSSTLFPGTLDMPVAQGSDVPSDCQFPASLTASGLELACIVSTGAMAEGDVGVESIAWLGANGWRQHSSLIGGFSAVRETGNGCEQVLNIYPHGDEESEEAGGIWFALEREPRCAAQQPTAQ